MSQNKARKYSSKGIKASPKTAREYKSAVNKLLWRKFRQTRATLSITLDEINVAYKAGVSAHEFVNTKTR